MPFDLTIFENIFSRTPFEVFWFLFINGGWVIFALAIPWGMWLWRLNFLRYKFLSEIPHVILAIDVPRDNEQNLKAVEQIFAHFDGIADPPNFVEKYWRGEVPLSVSLELISIDGYVQFLIRTPESFRDLIESAVYAQYPDAEITEVDDYTQSIPPYYPNAEYEIWGTEFKLHNKDPYPIRTHPSFEYGLYQQFADPMAAILEILSKLRKGEQIWFQWVITPPPNNNWRELGMKIIKKIIGDERPAPKSALATLFEIPINVTRGFGESFISPSGYEEYLGGLKFAESEAEKNQLSKRIFLSPVEKNEVEAIGNKISKVAFMVKFRMVYVAPKEIFAKGRGVAAVLGSIQQFDVKDLNGFKKDDLTKTSLDYFFVRRRLAARKTSLVARYRRRIGSENGQRPGIILNIEELASVYHFPLMTVKAPLVKRTEAKKGGPPVALPIEGGLDFSSTEVKVPVKPVKEEVLEESLPARKQPATGEELTPKGAPPTNLPVK